MSIVYLTSELAEKTQYNQIKDAYDWNELSVVAYDNVWCFEGKVSNEVRELVKEEMIELFPQYIYIYNSPYRKETL